MTASQLILVAAAISIASFAQVLSGFGFALLSMPIMTIAVPVQRAIVVSTLLGMLSTTIQAWHLRADVVRPLARRLSLSAFAGMPLGLFILDVVGDRTLRLVLGIAVLIATGLLASRLDLKHAGPALDVGAGFVSGVLSTSLSTNGPPLVVGLQARHLAPDEFRSTIAMVFAVSNVVVLTLFAIDDKFTSAGFKATLIALPAWVVGQALAWPIRHHFHGERFQALVLAMLAIAGVSSIVFALR